MENNRNFFITIALSVLILTLWQVFYMNPKIETERETARIEQERIAAEQKAAAAGRNARRCDPGASRRPASPARRRRTAAVADRAQAIAASSRVTIDTPSLSGLDQPDRRAHRRHQPQALPRDGRAEFADHRTARTRRHCRPATTAEIGFVGSDATGTVPGPDTVWTAEANATLTPDDAG